MYKIPRYGHIKDISLFFSSDSELRKDYMLGLILVFAMLMGIAAVWFLSLIVLRLLGHRVGCASGRPAVIPAEPMADTKGSVRTDETGEFIVMQADQNRVNRTRIIFFLSVLYTLAGCGIFMWSMFKTQGSMQDFYEYAEDIKDGFIQLPSGIDSTLASSATLQTPKTEMETALTNFCAAHNGDLVNGMNPQELGASLKTASQIIPNLNDDSSWSTYNASLTGMNEVLEDSVSFLSFLDSPKKFWFLGIIGCAGGIGLLAFFLLSCAWKSGREGYEFNGESITDCNSIFLNWVAIPLFALLIAGAWFVTAVVFTSGAANADFCYSEISTGNTVLEFVKNLGYDESSSFYLMTDDYLHNCVDGVSATMPAADDYNTVLTTVNNLITDFTSLNVAEVDAACGVSTQTVFDEATSFKSVLASHASDFEIVYEGLSCESVAPLVQKAVYETSCQSMSKAFLWTWVSGLCLSVFGSIIITLRSATSRPQIYLVSSNGDGGNDDNSYIVDSDDEY